MFLRFFGYVLSFLVTMSLVGLCCGEIVVSNVVKTLPDYESLKNYNPDLMTRIHAANGDLIGEIATKKRLYMPIASIPSRLKFAFISAEDKNFYRHFGLDPEGLLRAALTDIKYLWIGRRPEGASTITQQVAKNFLLSSDASFERKIKEAIIAIDMEKAYSKDHILELYLNEIYLGRGAYGVAAAALIYFNKSLSDLTLAQTAYLAALPKGPSNYDPFKHPQRALERRNWVIDRMYENGYITKAEMQQAKTEELGVVTTSVEDNVSSVSDYFVEEVRKELMEKYGSDKLYGGGLSVRSTLNPVYQEVARKALQNQLVKFDMERGWRGPYKHLNMKDQAWLQDFAKIPRLPDLPDWSLAIVTSVSDNKVSIMLQPKIKPSGDISYDHEIGIIDQSNMKWAFNLADKDDEFVRTARRVKEVLHIGDVVFVKKIPKTISDYSLCQIPQIQGAILAMDPRNGRVLAMVGGFSFAESEFNRAVQAYRQPGSAFKPIVYSAALDNGYTPASVVLDGPVEIDQQDGTTWKPKNYEGGYVGPATLRYGIEFSRNLMTVRLANDLGMKTVVEYAKRFGVYKNLQPVLAMALGAGETTLLKMVTAYAIIANKGQSLTPTFIDRIQDRYGKTIYKHDTRVCEACNSLSWHNQDEPIIKSDKEQVLDPMTAYQITSMLEGVIQRGTGKSLRYLNKHIAGKTGTTNDCKDAWFIGFTPNIVVGVYIGYDQPKSLGRAGTGAVVAAPVFGEFFSKALQNQPDVPFEIPQGMSEISINRKTGMHAQEEDQDCIIEAFKPGTGPADTYQVIGAGGSFKEGVRVPPLSEQAQDAIQSGHNGLY